MSDEKDYFELYKNNISKKLMRKLEGYKTEGYVPTYKRGRRKGQAVGRSGVTIANALDLGQRSNLDDISVSDKIKEKLKPYLGLTKKDAQDKLKELPLSLKEDEAKELSRAVSGAYYKKAADTYSTYSEGKDFSELPKPVQTVLFSRQFQQGDMSEMRGKAAAEGDYEAIYKDLSDSKRTPKWLRDRMQEEAEFMRKGLLEQNLKESIRLPDTLPSYYKIEPDDEENLLIKQLRDRIKNEA